MGCPGCRGHCCCQSIVTLDLPKNITVIQEGKHSSTRLLTLPRSKHLREPLIDSNSPGWSGIRFYKNIFLFELRENSTRILVRVFVVLSKSLRRSLAEFD